MTRSIPARPSLRHYRKEAKDLVGLAREGDAGIRFRIRTHSSPLEVELGAAFALHHAQRLIALEHGFPSWPRFAAAVETVETAASAAEDATARSVRSVREEGFVVLDEVFLATEVEALRTECEKVLIRKNRSRARVPLELHRRPPFNDRHVYANPVAMPIVEGLFGEPVTITEFWIRATRPGEGSMHIHRDGKKLPAPSRIEVISVDLMLTACRDENGATQIFAGSHLVPDRDLEDVRDTQRRAEKLPRTSLVGAAGSAIVRDGRAWHCNGENRADAPRIMLSLVYARRLGPCS